MISIPFLSLLAALLFVTQGFGFPQFPRQASSTQASLPQSASDPKARADAIGAKRAGWLYGAPLLGGSFFPTGPLGGARIQHDVGIYTIDFSAENASIYQDLPNALNAIGANGGLRSLADYVDVLYKGQWINSIPDGEDAGILSNYTQDLLFSMERLSLNPYPLVRLQPNDQLPFTVPEDLSKAIATQSLESLRAQGRLFIVDHSYQSKYPAVPGRYGAACTAYFFLHPVSGDFLPLAIKTNAGSQNQPGSNLLYTPLDSANDWLFAKILFNVNDYFHSQAYHLLATHDVGEIVHQAAMRSLSDDHPIMKLLERLMVGAYAVRVVGAARLFNEGGAFDEVFYLNHTAAINFQNDFYPTGGAYQANNLDADLVRRRLIPSTSFSGPSFKSFPFYEDASQIRNVIQGFMTSFVDAYYANDAMILADTELQAWFAEANGPAQVVDFGCKIPIKSDRSTCGKASVVQILTHFAYLNGVVHHALNTGDISAASSTLPFHPSALYAPLPTSKGLTDAQLLAFLPPPAKAIRQITLVTAFNRPQYAAQNRTLMYAYSDAAFLSQFNDKVTAAAGTYFQKMSDISKAIRGRKFDAHGLSQGMPFIWKAVDPGTVPWFTAI